MMQHRLTLVFYLLLSLLICQMNVTALSTQDPVEILLGIWSGALHHPAPSQNGGICCIPDTITITKESATITKSVWRFSQTNMGCQGRFRDTLGFGEIEIAVVPTTSSMTPTARANPFQGDLPIYPDTATLPARLYWKVDSKLKYLLAQTDPLSPTSSQGACGFYMTTKYATPTQAEFETEAAKGDIINQQGEQQTDQISLIQAKLNHVETISVTVLCLLILTTFICLVQLLSKQVQNFIRRNRKSIFVTTSEKQKYSGGGGGCGDEIKKEGTSQTGSSLNHKSLEEVTTSL